MSKIYAQLKIIDDILVDSLIPTDAIDARVDLKELAKKIHRVREACNKEV
jgi:hypothetical protein